VNTLTAARSQPGVRAAAVVGTERRVLEGGFGNRTDAVLELAQAARQILRDTHPEPHFLVLMMEDARIVFVPAGHAVLVLETTRELSIQALTNALTETLVSLADVSRQVTSREGAEPENQAIAQRHVAPQAREPLPVVAPRIDPTFAAMDLLRATIVEAKRHLGPLVVRNYLKQERTALLPREPRLDSINVALDGSVVLEGAGDALLAEALRAWAQAFFARARVTAPAMAAGKLDSAARIEVNNVQRRTA